MRVSAKVDYALRALLEIAAVDGRGERLIARRRRDELETLGLERVGIL